MSSLTSKSFIPNSESSTEPTQVVNPTRVENPVSEIRRLTEQDSSVEMESRAAEGLARGYTRIPNLVLMQMIGGDFTRNEIRIALVIARFTISYRREFAPLSKKVLERQSGLRGPAVLEAVAGLVTKGLVQKKKGDQYRPNMLGLILPVEWQQGNGPRDEKQEFLPIATTVENASNPTLEKETAGEVSDSTPFKDIIKYKNNLSSLPATLQSYFDELKPARKRESELRAFENLQSEFNVSDIAECLELLVNRGIRIGKTGAFQDCHSPMAYLSKAIHQVLLDIRKKQKAAAVTTIGTVPAQDRDEQWKAQQAYEFSLIEQAFLAAHPTAELQRQTIVQICPNAFINSPVVRRMYAIRIWSKRSGAETQLTVQAARGNHGAN